jgi:hypothetical protein
VSFELYTRAIDDLLAAERHLRHQLESSLRDHREVLLYLAQVLGGEALEAYRRIDPDAPDSWAPFGWRQFFDSLPLGPSSRAWHAPLKAENKALRLEILQLKEQLVSASLPAPESAPAAPQADDEAAILEHASLLEELQGLALKDALPEAARTCLKSSDETRLRRQLYLLYLTCRGMNIRVEIDYLISQMEKISLRTGALRRACDALQDSGLLTIRLAELGTPRTSLAICELTESGLAACQLLGWARYESEWERLGRLHAGENQPDHTLGVLIFAMQARFRGYQTSIMPVIPASAQAANPDVMVSNGDGPLYVEVELSNKAHLGKWRNLAAIQEQVALCGRNRARRLRLAADCRQLGLPGVATDIETMLGHRLPDLAAAAPLWVERW